MNIDPSLLFDSRSLWSLWVPFGLLGFILLAAIYFVRVSTR